MSTSVSTIFPTSVSNRVVLSLRACASVLAVAGSIKVAQTGAIGFALFLVVPWVVLAVRSRPGPRSWLAAVIVGTLELALVGSAIAANGWSAAWFDLVVVTSAIIVAPIAVALGGYLLVRRQPE